ncbi:hypothetical protein DFP72DRAFT_860641 [Ephemerocybe angulata]|uniref:Uncharacterized protein n=1 Tax=Ephemerocybe angulata TaxID=980116 RepID=A0A8H6LV47_9AGAR|nr:hypothetical protein DFP72DRAFT_860641 [Tulosesus angulatus]
MAILVAERFVATTPAHIVPSRAHTCSTVIEPDFTSCWPSGHRFGGGLVLITQRHYHHRVPFYEAAHSPTSPPLLLSLPSIVHATLQSTALHYAVNTSIGVYNSAPPVHINRNGWKGSRVRRLQGPAKLSEAAKGAKKTSRAAVADDEKKRRKKVRKENYIYKVLKQVPRGKYSVTFPTKPSSPAPQQRLANDQSVWKALGPGANRPPDRLPRRTTAPASGTTPTTRASAIRMKTIDDTGGLRRSSWR